MLDHFELFFILYHRNDLYHLNLEFNFEFKFIRREIVKNKLQPPLLVSVLIKPFQNWLNWFPFANCGCCGAPATYSQHFNFSTFWRSLQFAPNWFFRKIPLTAPYDDSGVCWFQVSRQLFPTWLEFHLWFIELIGNSNLSVEGPTADGACRGEKSSLWIDLSSYSGSASAWGLDITNTVWQYHWYLVCLPKWTCLKLHTLEKEKKTATFLFCT